MYENMTFDKIEKRMLARVRSTFDKREGSIIYDANVRKHDLR
nr:MAG TPA: Baseplate J like protein [Caudoviricetes sp.]